MDIIVLIDNLRPVFYSVFFTVSLVFPHFVRPANYKKGIDPEVATVWKTTQLLDLIEDKLIAIWDFTHNAWFFYEKFFQIDPDAECCYKFTWDPEVLLFKPKR